MDFDDAIASFDFSEGGSFHRSWSENLALAKRPAAAAAALVSIPEPQPSGCARGDGEDGSPATGR